VAAAWTLIANIETFPIVLSAFDSNPGFISLISKDLRVWRTYERTDNADRYYSEPHLCRVS